MDLGLHTLTDDQLLELLGEACAELTQREHYVRTLAQQTIFSEAEKLKVMRTAMEDAVARVKDDHVVALRKEVEDEVRRLVASGEIKLFPDGEESKMVVQTDLDVRAKMIQEVRAKADALKSGTTRFQLSLHPGGMITLLIGDSRFEGNARVSERAIEKIMSELYVMLH